MKRIWLVFICMILLVSFVSGATLTGNVYDYSLEPVSGVKVSIDTVPRQQLILTESYYSLNVAVGQYELVAYQIKNGEIIGYAREDIFVKEEGNYTFDLVLYPYLNTDYLPADLELFEQTPISQKKEKKSFLVPVILIFLGIICVVIGALVLLKKKKDSHVYRKSVVNTEHQGDVLPDDLNKIIDFLKSESGRSTQKEVRKILPLSEAKVSLMIAELESRGMVKKIKKGRGNILILADYLKDKMPSPSEDEDRESQDVGRE